MADARGGVFFHELSRGLEDLKKLNIPYRILFLEASDDVLVRRQEAARRPHPLQEGARLLDGISREREMVRDLLK